MDFERHEVRLGGELRHLTAVELRLLGVLIREPGRVFTREQLVERVFGYEYEELTRRLELTRMEHWLLGYHAATDGWEGLQSYISGMSVLYGYTIAVANAQGTVVADSRVGTSDEPANAELPERELPLDRSGEPTGILYVSDEPTVATAYTRALADSVNIFLLWGSLLAGTVALVLTHLLARRIAAPVRDLAEPARLADGGDLSVRVAIRDKGEIGELAAAMNAMVADLERAGRLRRHMVADTAHELRTPISDIVGYLEAYDDGMADRDLVMNMVSEEASVLARLVEDLHELATADAGNYHLSIESTSMPVLLKRVLVSIRPAAARKGIAVADTGEGIAEEELENVFERYYRTDRSRARATGGSGLGLCIAKQIVQAHGGRIYAKSQPSGGTRMVFLLPTTASSTGIGY